jgi:hypothetical protein
VQIEDLNYNSTPLSLGGKGWDRENYKKFITPYTAIIDLTKTEQEILV